MDPFYTTSPEELGQLSPDRFAEAIQALDWTKFKPSKHAAILRQALTTQAQAHGIGEGHYLATKNLIERNSLVFGNAYAHTSNIAGFALSPDASMFASGSEAGSNYSDGGYVLMFEAATGMAYFEAHVEGGQGWSWHDDTLQFSPDGKMLGLAFDTNGIGCMKVPSFGVEFSCYVTDGMDEPPAFCWSGDGSKIHIACWGGKGKPKKGQIEIPLCNFDYGTEKEQWAPPQNVDAESLPAFHRCRGYGKIVVGQGRHSQAYALHADTLQVLWHQHADNIFFARNLFFLQRQGTLTAIDPQTFQQQYTIEATAISQVFTSPSDSTTPLVGISDGKGNVEVYQGSKHLSSIPTTLPGPHAEGLKAMAFSLDDKHFALLDEDQRVTVYQNPAQPLPIHQSVHEKGEGIFLAAHNTLIVAGGEYLCFIDFLTGEVRARYLYEYPDHDHGLKIKGQNLGDDLIGKALVFPLPCGERVEWAYLFLSGHIILPEGADTKGIPSLAVFRHALWPIQWMKLQQVSDLHAYASLPGNLFEDTPYMQMFGPKASASKSKTKAPTESPTATSSQPEPHTLEYLYEDIVNLFSHHKGGGYEYAVNKTYCQLAVLHARKGRFKQALDLTQLLSHNYSKAMAYAWIAAEMKWQGVDAGDLLTKLEEALAQLTENWEKTRVNSVAGGVFLLYGKEEHGKACLKRGQEHWDQDSNTGESRSYHVQGWILAGEYEQAFEALRKKFDDVVSDGFDPAFCLLCQKATMDQILPFIKLLKQKDVFGLDDYLEQFLQAVIRTQAWDLIDQVEKLFEQYDSDEAISRILRAMKGHADDTLLKDKLHSFLRANAKYPDTWAQFLVLALQLFPEEATRWNGTANSKFEKLFSASTYRATFFRNYIHAQQLTSPTTAETYLTDYDADEWLLLAGAFGLLEAMPAGKNRDDLMTKMLGWLAVEQEEPHLKYAELGTYALKFGMEKLAEECWKSAAKAAKSEYEKQYVATVWSDAGFHDFAYRTWMKIPPAKRGYTMGNMVENLGKAGRISELYTLLEGMGRNTLSGAPSQLLKGLMAAEGIDEKMLPS